MYDWNCVLYYILNGQCLDSNNYIPEYSVDFSAYGIFVFDTNVITFTFTEKKWNLYWKMSRHQCISYENTLEGG